MKLSVYSGTKIQRLNISVAVLDFEILNWNILAFEVAIIYFIKLLLREGVYCFPHPHSVL